MADAHFSNDTATLESASSVTLLPEVLPSLPGLEELPVATTGLELKSLLGEGTTGTVHTARHALLDRDVAVKRLKAGTAEGVFGRLLHEGRVMGSLEHPNIIPVHAIGVDDEGRPALVMKRVEGRTWKPGEQGLEADLRILLEVGRALGFAHRRGVVHRDLKPANVLLGPHGEVYLADWGIAVHTGQATAPAGTPAFMAPEMFVAGIADPSMDAYVLGACLHEIVTGEARNPGQHVRECRERIEEPRTAHREGVDTELASLADAACALERSQRAPLGVTIQGVGEWLSRRGAVELAAAANRRLDRLRASTELDVTELTECLFAFRQAIEQRPGHAAYIDGLQELLKLAVLDASSRDVRAEMATSWIEELERDGQEVTSLRQALQASMSRQKRQAAMAFDADYQVEYGARFRVYAVWLGAFMALLVPLQLFSVVDQETHGSSVLLGVLFLGTLAMTAALSWKTLTANAAGRALLQALFFIGVLIVGNRSICAMLDVPVAWMHAWDAALMGACVVTLGFTQGAVTRVLGAVILCGAPLILLVPEGWSWAGFVGVAAVMPVAFALAMRGRFRAARMA